MTETEDSDKLPHLTNDQILLAADLMSRMSDEQLTEANATLLSGWESANVDWQKAMTNEERLSLEIQGFHVYRKLWTVAQSEIQKRNSMKSEWHTHLNHCFDDVVSKLVNKGRMGF